MNRRKKKFIRPDVQLKIVFITFLVAVFVLLINFQLNVAGLWSLSSDLSGVGSVDVALEETRMFLIQKFFLALLIAIPLSFSVAILYSFRFSGPLYRFKIHLTDLAAGRWGATLRLRDRDQLLDIRDAINSAADSFRSAVREDVECLKETRALLDRLTTKTDEPRESLVRLRERVADVIVVREAALANAGVPAAAREPSADLEAAPVATPASPSASTAPAAAPAASTPAAASPAAAASAAAPERELEEVV
jgi:methyl-accepting chemotaxis protein